MALLFMDGFDYGDVYAGQIGKWDPATASTSTAHVRTGTHAMRCTSGGEALTKALPASGGFVVGAAIYLDIANDNAADVLQIREGTTVHLTFSVLSGSNLPVVRRGTTVLATGVTPIPIGAWNYLEFKGTIDATAGSFEVRIDGLTVPQLTMTGQNTRNGGATGQWNRVRFGTLNAFQTTGTHVDDLYVLDQSGPAPRNNFLGPVKIETLIPQTDAVAAGSTLQWTPSTSTDHGALVDEKPPNSTDYVSSSTVGHKDTYNLPTPTLTGTLFAVQTNLYAWKADTFARKMCPVVRVGGLDYDGTDVVLTTSPWLYSEIRPQTPTGSEWVTADITGLQVGIKLTL